MIFKSHKSWIKKHILIMPCTFVNFAFPSKTTRTHNNHQQNSNFHFHIYSCFITCANMFLDPTIIKVFYQLQQFIAIFCIDEIVIDLVRGFIIFSWFYQFNCKTKILRSSCISNFWFLSFYTKYRKTYL